MNDLGRELMRGVAVGTGKPLDEVGQRLATLLTRLFTSRDLQESKARLEESQRVAHVGYWVWNLDTDRVTWSDETYRIFGLKPQEGPNIATADQKRLVIVGATGMVGGYALHYALENPAVASVTAIGRRKLGISHPKLKEVLHQDFADCSALAEDLAGKGAAIFCLGTYTGSVPDAELRTITVNYTGEFARVFHSSSPDAAFSFLSGNGADPTGRSRLAFARFKGEAEKALLAEGFPRVYLFRPGTSIPSSRGRNRISATGLCARSTPRFGYCSLTR
jgi:hypothetical protein